MPDNSTKTVEIPDGVFEAIIARDYMLAVSLLKRNADKQQTADWLKYRLAVEKIEKEFRKLTDRSPWGNVKDSDLNIYRKRVAAYCHRLTVKYLIDDIRLCPQAWSLKYFIVPALNRRDGSPDRAARWEIAWTDIIVKRHQEEKEKLIAEELAACHNVELPLVDTIPEWVLNSCRDIDLVNARAKATGKDLIAHFDTNKIAKLLKFHGWQVKLDKDKKAFAVPLDRHHSRIQPADGAGGNGHDA